MSNENKYKQALSAVVEITMESLEGGSMSKRLFNFPQYNRLSGEGTMEKERGMSNEHNNGESMSDKISTKTNDRPYPSLEVFVEGIGTNSEEEGSAIYLEYFEGRWWLRVWSDINNQDPTHSIDMSGALESRRDGGTVLVGWTGA